MVVDAQRHIPRRRTNAPRRWQVQLGSIAGIGGVQRVLFSPKLTGLSTMTTFVFIAVLGAAALHAAWNALLKQGGDKTTSMGAIVLGHVPLALIALPFVPTPAIESYHYWGVGSCCTPAIRCSCLSLTKTAT